MLAIKWVYRITDEEDYDFRKENFGRKFGQDIDDRKLLVSRRGA